MPFRFRLWVGRACSRADLTRMARCGWPPAAAVGVCPSFFRSRWMSSPGRALVPVRGGPDSEDRSHGQRMALREPRDPCRCRIRHTVRAGTPVSAATRGGPNREDLRASTTARSRLALARVGVDLGWHERSGSPAAPSARNLLNDRCAVCRGMPSSAAIWAGRPAATHFHLARRSSSFSGPACQQTCRRGTPSPRLAYRAA